MRNHRSHPVRGEVDYIAADGTYRSPSTATPLLAPGAAATVNVEVRPEDWTSGAVFRVRERLIYFDGAHFDRSRVTPFHTLEAGAR